SRAARRTARPRAAAGRARRATASCGRRYADGRARGVRPASARYRRRPARRRDVAASPPARARIPPAGRRPSPSREVTSIQPVAHRGVDGESRRGQRAEGIRAGHRAVAEIPAVEEVARLEGELPAFQALLELEIGDGVARLLARESIRLVVVEA